MTLQGEYVPSPEQWVRDQVELFEATDGAEGNTLRGVPIVVITSVGARSGRLRKNPVMRVEHEGSYAAVASQGGAPEHPSWYFNFVAQPRVEVQDGAVRRPYVAREVSGEEKATWWERAVAVWPHYAEYQERTDREIPVFVLEPVTD
jgi:deazaflavin-dependent oxidoreductase (nitroreductase family)